MGHEREPEALPRPLAGIVLAAGGASRFGSPKQVARLGGVSLVAGAARLALAVCPAGAVVVTGAHAGEVRASLAGISILLAHNKAWATGIAGSIRCGLEALPAEAGACLVMLCDQPVIDEPDLRRLVAAWATAPHRVAAAQYAGGLGAPAVFPSEHWADLRGLRGDQGARALIASLADVTAVALPHAAHDVDTPGDLAARADP